MVYRKFGCMPLKSAKTFSKIPFLANFLTAGHVSPRILEPILSSFESPWRKLNLEVGWNSCYASVFSIYRGEAVTYVKLEIEPSEFGVRVPHVQITRVMA